MLRAAEPRFSAIALIPDGTRNASGVDFNASNCVRVYTTREPVWGKPPNRREQVSKVGRMMGADVEGKTSGGWFKTRHEVMREDKGTVTERRVSEKQRQEAGRYTKQSVKPVRSKVTTTPDVGCVHSQPYSPHSTISSVHTSTQPAVR